MNYQDTLEEELITGTKTHLFMIDEKDLIKELSVHAIAELSDLNADGVTENIIGEVPAELEEAAKEAAEACPVDAIVNE